MRNTINDYPAKEILVADLIRICGDKNHYKIISSENDEELYDGRAEYLEWSSDGYTDQLCDMVVELMDVLNDGILMMYVRNPSPVNA